MAEFKVDHGKMPDWGRADLPAPPPFNLTNVMAVIGPGIIGLSMGIGSGEWLMGPAVSAQYGPTLLWMTTVAVFFQVIFNQECARYVIATGETCFGGFMRTSPGPRFWGWVYAIMGALQFGWPGWAAASASAIFAATMGRLPGAGDSGAMLAWGYTSFALVVLVLLFGGTVERGLEKICTVLTVLIFSFLVLTNIIFVPAANWLKVFEGLLNFGSMPKGADWVLLGAFAAYSGTGGMGNILTASWMRDKGFGMGKVVGAIPSAFSGKEISLSKIGSIFDPAKENNLSAWKTWWKYVWVDQGVVWGLGCILGMFFCVNLAYSIIPEGVKLTGWAAGAYQAQYMGKFWGPLFFLTLFIGFWIMWDTQLSITDGYVRAVTDIIWSSTKKPHTWKGGPKTVYYISLLCFTAWGCIAINMAQPMMLLIIGANMAGFIFIVSCPHIVYVNNKFLPKPLRPAMWRNVVMILMMLFYLFFFLALVGQQTGLWKFKF
jgi:hypothetical protein